MALLGTPFTMTQPFYKGRLKQLHGVDVLLPTEEQGEEIYRVINEELTFKHILKEESRRYFLDVIDSLRAQGAQGRLLGCTEIPLLIQQERYPICPYLILPFYTPWQQWTQRWRKGISRRRSLFMRVKTTRETRGLHQALEGLNTGIAS